MTHDNDIHYSSVSLYSPMAHVNPLVPRVQVPDDSDDDNDPDDTCLT